MPVLVTSPWRAMATRPWRFLTSGWPWRSLGYLCSGAVAATPSLLLVQWITAVEEFWAYLAGCAVLLLFCLVVAVPLGALERRRLRIIAPTAPGLPHDHSPAPRGLGWLRVRLAEPATWREFCYAALFVTVLALGNVLVVAGTFGVLFAPVGAALVILLDNDLAKFDGIDIITVVAVWLGMLVLAAYVATAMAAVQSALAHRLLANRNGALIGQVRDLSRSRMRLVDAFELERSRIERDLHDGAQQRLMGLTMMLGLAELSLSGVAGDAPRFVANARREAEAALGELRELIRGIHPRVLVDRGIEAAVAEVAARCPVPVEIRFDLPGRPSRAVEAVAYFAVSEALANVAKHADADQAEVTGTAAGGRLLVSVVDDGTGGADFTQGTGLQGLADRVAAVGGRFRLTSPPGGPTRLEVELPWRTPDCP